MNKLAQIYNPVLPPILGGSGGNYGGIGLGIFISNTIGLLFIASFLMALIFLIMGGLQWVTSGGDKNNLESARNKITHAIIGLIIVGAAWSIMTIIGQFLGITFPILPIPNIGTGR